ncbi:RNA-binding protein CP33, chloroplastic [Pseudocercospora fuligena]|uniref:RNA-binding protein CP33, chloroplastic n=1 Tax=Pseudocercospora fuligena TaxID=685502 RepID=A0A8H6RQA9_9PEZI|nr:RNA-binding protein CP33, chloroplastic [Pseudocercospora fuligena]
MAETNARLYVGNLPYVAQKSDIENFFSQNNVAIKKIDISTDPFTGRNPSYCFVDFHSEEEAAQAMENLQGQEIRGRPVRINPKTERSSFKERLPTKVWDRNWTRREVPSRDVDETAHAFDRWNRDDAQTHWSAPENEKRRIWVGGLPRIPNQDSLNAEMRELFQGYNVQAVSKLISPHASKESIPGSHHFCFVDMSNALETQEAIEALNGKENPYGAKYIVRLSQRRAPNQTTKVEREQLTDVSRIFVGQLPHYEDQASLDNDIRQLLAGFEIRSITKLFTPSAAKMEEGGDQHFCFVDLSSPQDAQNAIDRLDNQPTPSGGAYKIRMARPPPPNAGSGARREQVGGNGGRFEQKKPQGPPRDFGGSWRRAD